MAYFAVEMAEEKHRNVQKSYLQTDVITGVKSRGMNGSCYTRADQKLALCQRESYLVDPGIKDGTENVHVLSNECRIKSQQKYNQ